MAELKPCPICKKTPKIGYACGEYFVSGDDDDCPGCGFAFTEMHSSKKQMIDAWNRSAEDGNELYAVTAIEIQTVCLICGEGVPVFGGIYTPKICEKCKAAVMKVRE